MPKLLLRLEGAIVAVLSIWLYANFSGSWLMFLLLVLVPDLTFLAYLGGKSLGAFFYNLLHTYVGPGLLIALGWLGDTPMVISLALIWSAHIGLDRMLGYGLKYPTDFKDTHMDRV